MVLLHELAHVAAPQYRWTTLGERSPISHRKRGPIRLQEHGPEFVTAMLGLVGAHLGDGVAAQLRSSFADFGVEPMDADAYGAALEADRGLVQPMRVLAEAFAREKREFEETRPPVSVRAGDRSVPVFIWGDVLLYRGQDHKINGRRSTPLGLCRQLAPVVACTREDLEAIYSSEAVPEDERLRRIAICHAILIGLDPIWMQTSLGLARWVVEPELELDELERLNPEWVALVRGLNAELSRAQARLKAADEA